MDKDTQAAHLDQVQRRAYQLEKERLELESRLENLRAAIHSLLTSPETAWVQDPPVRVYERILEVVRKRLAEAEKTLKSLLEPSALPLFPIAKLCDFGMCRTMFPCDQTAAATTVLNTGIYKAPLSSLLTSPTHEEAANDLGLANSFPSQPAISNQEIRDLLTPLPPLPPLSKCATIPSHISSDPLNPPRFPTPRVMTVSYRAAEVLLDKPLYTQSIDLWSIGCIIPELVTLNILVEYIPVNRDAGEHNAHVDYGEGLVPNIISLFQALGIPKSREEWDAICDPSSVNAFARDFPKFKSKLKEVSGGAMAAALGEDGMDLLTKMLLFTPEHRITAQQALDHKWLAEVRFTELPKAS